MEGFHEEMSLQSCATQKTIIPTQQPTTPTLQQPEFYLHMILAACVFVIGILLGLYVAQRKSSTTKNKVSKTLTFSLVPEDKAPVSTVLFPQSEADVVGDVETEKGIMLMSPTLDAGYEYCIEKAKCSLLSILGLSSPDLAEKDRYASRPWSLMPSGSMSYLWTCNTESDGIMLRTSMVVKSNTKAVLQWLVQRNIFTGMETTCCENVLIKHFHGGCVSVRRLCCDSGSLTSSKRDFVVVTSISMLPDGCFLVASRSIYIPDHITIHHRKGRNGYVRGIIYTSGFVLRPVKCPIDGACGCEVFYAAHLDMLGPPSGNANSSQLNKLNVSVLSVMERIDEFFASSKGESSPTAKNMKSSTDNGGDGFVRASDDPMNNHDKNGSSQPMIGAIAVLKALKTSRVVIGHSSCACPNLLQLGTNKPNACPEEGRFVSIAHAPTDGHLRTQLKLTLDQKVNLQSAGCNAVLKIRHLHETLFGSGALSITHPSPFSSYHDPCSPHDNNNRNDQPNSNTRRDSATHGPKKNPVYSGNYKYQKLSYDNLANILKYSTKTGGDGITKERGRERTDSASSYDNNTEFKQAPSSSLTDRPKQPATTVTGGGGGNSRTINLVGEDAMYGRHQQIPVKGQSLRSLSMDSKEHTLNYFGSTDGNSGWDNFYQHDDIFIFELLSSNSKGAGVLAAHCTTLASPAEVRNVLMHYPEQVDLLMARRTVLNRLDNETFLQWMGYGLGRDWPLGLRDFLVVTSEESINDFNDGFVIASTSVDQICEEIDDIDNSVEEIMGKDNCGHTFQRASITISGFVGLPDGNGGTNLTLFIDSDGYEHTPSWLLRLLAQYELCEMMNRIRAIPPLHAVSSGRSTPIGLTITPKLSQQASGSMGAPSSHPITTTGHTSLLLSMEAKTLESMEKQKKKAKDLEKLLTAAEQRRRVSATTANQKATSGSTSRFQQAFQRIISGSTKDGSTHSLSPRGTGTDDDNMTAPTVVTKRPSLLSSMMLGRRKKDKNNTRVNAQGPNATILNMTSASSTSSMGMLQREANTMTRSYSASTDTADALGLSVSNSSSSSATYRRGSQQLSPRGNGNDSTHFTCVLETNMDHSGEGDDGSDVQGLLYEDNESVPEEESESEIDREVIEAFREASQISLISDSQDASQSSRFPMKQDKSDSNAPRTGPGPCAGGGYFVKEGLEIAVTSIRMMKVYLGLESDVTSLGTSLSLDWQQRVAKKNLTVSSTMVAGSNWQAVRAITTIAAEKDVILALLSNDCRMGEFDDMFDFITPLVKVDARTAIRRICFKPVWPTAPRDFLVCTSWTELEDGSMLLCSRSAPDDVLSQQKGYVRGFIRISGYYIQPRSVLKSTDPFYADCPLDGCKVTLTAHTELGGTLPSSVINMLSTAAPMKMLTTIGEVAKTDQLARPSAIPFTLLSSSVIASSHQPHHASSSSVKASASLNQGDDQSASATPNPDDSVNESRDGEYSVEDQLQQKEIIKALEVWSPSISGKESEVSASPPHRRSSRALSRGHLINMSPTGNSNHKSPSPTKTSSCNAGIKGNEDPQQTYVLEGLNIAHASIRLHKVYLGLESDVTSLGTSLSLDWQQRVAKKNLTVSSTMVAGSHWQAIRAVTTMQANKGAILALIMDDSRIGEYDDMFDSYHHLVKVDDHTAIRRVCCKAIWPTAPRDFLVCTTWTKLEDGSIMVCSRSAPDDVFGQQKGYVRGFLNISGYFIQPRDTLSPAEQATTDCPLDGCKVTLTAHTELGGNLPSSVINMLSTAAPLKMLTAIGDLVSSSSSLSRSRASSRMS